MATASYTILDIEAHRIDGKLSHVNWRGEFTDSDGGKHWSSVVYGLTPESAHSPEAAALFAAAQTEKDIALAVHADARRALRELEDPLSPAGSRPMANVEILSIDPEV